MTFVVPDELFPTSFSHYSSVCMLVTYVCDLVVQFSAQ